MENQSAIMSKIAKLLKLADQSRNSSEAEASAAAAKVQELLQEHGLSLAQIEAAGGTSDDGGRKKESVDGYRINHPWQVKLMTAIAETNFCICRVSTQDVERNGRRIKSKRFQLVGRAVNVQATKMVYEYLFETMRRLALDQGYVTKDFADGRKDNESHLQRKRWNEGCTDRLVERLEEKKAQAEAESKRRAARQQAASGGGRALILSDVYGSEAELNNDVLNGFPLGTTAARRRDNEARHAACDAKFQELIKSGVERIEAYYLAHGYGAQDAQKLAANYHREMNRPARGGGRGYRGAGFSTARSRKNAERVNSEAYQAGAATGKTISLDPQTTHKNTKKLGDK